MVVLPVKIIRKVCLGVFLVDLPELMLFMKKKLQK